MEGGDAEEVGGCSREPSGSAGDSGQQGEQQGRLVIGWWGEAGQEWKRQWQEESTTQRCNPIRGEILQLAFSSNSTASSF